MNKKNLIVFFALPFLFASCVQQESLASYSEKKPIDFRTSFSTRGISDEITTANLSSFYVTAMQGELVYFEGVKFSKNPNNNYFQSETAYYWPEDDSELVFYAHNAYRSYFEYNDNKPRVKLDEFSSEDIIGAKASGRLSTNASVGVPLEFKHLSSQIEIRVKNSNPLYEVTMSCVSFSNISVSAYYNFNDNSIDSLSPGLVGHLTEQDLVLNDEYTTFRRFYTIPQSADAWEVDTDKTNHNKGAVLNFEIEAVTQDGLSLIENTYPHFKYASIPVDINWERGYKYVYEIDFSNGLGYYDPEHPKYPGEPILGMIKFNVTVTPWNETEEMTEFTYKYIHRQELQSKPAVSDYDLSTKGDTEARNTANCYLVNAPGTYKLPLYMGNSIKNGALNEISYTTGEDPASKILSTFVDYNNDPITNPHIPSAYPGKTLNCKLVRQDRENLVSNVHISEDSQFLCFNVEAQYIDQGNAVLAVYDESNNILWSWHIWVTDYVLGSDLRTVTNHEGAVYEMMPINLGWVYDEYITDPSSYGYSCYYQYGRKDPFFGYDSSWSPISSTKGIAYSIKNPDTFISAQGWCGSEYYNLWNMKNDKVSVNDDKVYKTIYDPCPAGYCLPPSGVYTGFTSTGANITNWGDSNIARTFENGYIFYCDNSKTSTISFPESGYRSYTDGSKIQFNRGGHYWTSGPRSENTYYNLHYWAYPASAERMLGEDVPLFCVRTIGWTSPGDACTIKPIKEK